MSEREEREKGENFEYKEIPWQERRERERMREIILNSFQCILCN